MRLAEYEEKEKREQARPLWIRNARDIVLIIAAFIGFAVLAVILLPLLPGWARFIFVFVGVMTIGSFIRKLAK